MRSEQIQERLKRLVSQAQRDLRSEGSDMTEEQLLGLILANYFRWNGVKVLETAAVALEDANYHRECEVILGLLRDAKRTFRRKK